MKKLLLFIFTIIALNSFSQATLVQDINLGTFSSSPANKVNFNGFVYFIANDGLNGSELWRTDGTESGTEIFKEFITGSESGMVAVTPFVSNGFMYFVAKEGANNFLWKTDGTLIGTEKVKQFSAIQGFHETINNELVFTAENQLWKTDGTAAGTIKLSNFTIFGSTRFVKSGNEIFFSGEASTSIGQELYKTNGTTVSLVKNIYPNSNKDAYPNNFSELNGVVYFSADNGSNGFELWKTDGTEAGTELVKDINPGSGSVFSTDTPIVAFNNEMFFMYGTKLYKSDGTDAGTVEVKDVESYVKRMFVFNSKLHIFNGSNSFWVSDGTEIGTTKIEVAVNEFFHNNQYGIVGNELFFQANNECGYEIWVTDGTAEGTKMVKDIHPSFDDNNIEDIIELNGEAIFTASDGNWLGKELWISDGTENGTTILKDINKEGNNSSSPQNYFEFGDKVLFSADNGENGKELWVINSGVATLLKDINPGPRYSNPSGFIELNGVVYFKANTKNEGLELWKTDGTNAGTSLVKDINPNEKDGLSYGNIVVLNSKLYFFGNDGTYGGELWESDGTEAGTILIKDINVGTANSYRNGKITVYNNALFFNATDTTNDYEIWKSDGTNAGTNLLKNIHTSGSSSPDNFIVFDNTLFFTATDATNGNELWRSDGKASNTVLARNIKAGSSSSYPSNFIISGAGNKNKVLTYDTQLLFTATGANGNEIWQIEVGTSHYPQPIQGGSGSYPYKLTNHNGEAFFITGNELWKVNQYASGASVVKPGDDVKNISEMMSFGGVLIFGAGNNSQNIELWKSDGTTDGTVLFQDINPSTAQYGNGSSPSSFFRYNSTLYFSANNGTNGSELFKLEESALSVENKTINTLADVSLYPNPASSILNIKIDNQQIIEVKIFSLMGKEVMNVSAENNKINISQLSSGMYFVKLKIAKNTFTKEILKQ